MHRNRIRIERIVSAGPSINSEADDATEKSIASHRGATGPSEFAFDSYSLRNVSRLAHRHRERFGAPHFDEFCRRDSFLARRENDIGATWIAHHAQLLMHAPRDRCTGSETQNRQEQ